jgi:hypothetical protein
VRFIYAFEVSITTSVSIETYIVVYLAEEMESKEDSQTLGVNKKPTTPRRSSPTPGSSPGALSHASGRQSRSSEALSPASRRSTRSETPSKRRSARKSKRTSIDGSPSSQDPKALEGLIDIRTEMKTQKYDDERWSSRLWRLITRTAGLNRPLGKDDFKHFSAKHNNDASKILADIGNHANHTDVIHRDEFIFDFYLLIKDSRLSFIVGLVLVYFVLISLVFGSMMNSAGCLGEEIKSRNLFGAGFMIVSGMVDLDYSMNSTSCVYIDGLAVLVGLYVSLPVFSAVILIRLLSNKHKHLRMSKNLLLNKRDGVPCVQMRVINQSGNVLTNLRVHVEAWVSRGRDIETGENYFDLMPVDFTHPYTVGGTPFTVCHKVTEESVLKKGGVIYIDETTGAPRVNKELKIVWSVCATAETEMGGRSTMYDTISMDDNFVVEANSGGDLPFFSNASISMISDWLKSEGKSTPSTDASRLSKWEYNTAYRESLTRHEDNLV